MAAEDLSISQLIAYAASTSSLACQYLGRALPTRRSPSGALTCWTARARWHSHAYITHGAAVSIDNHLDGGVQSLSARMDLAAVELSDLAGADYDPDSHRSCSLY